MAFLKTDIKNKETYLRICENERQGNKVIQKTLYSLGTLSQYSSESLQRMGERLYSLGGGNLNNLIEHICQEKGRYNYGFPFIIKHLCHVFQLDIFFGRLERKHRLSFSLTEVVQLLLCNRWSNPLSKLGVYETQDDYIGFSSMKLHHLYRTLDKLSSASTALQEHLYKCNTKLIDYQIDVVFYDVTTFYFESEVVQEKALRQIGFGKDGKVGNTQILLGLLLDKQRNPLGYELYSGDTYEGHTLADSIKKLKTRYKIDKVVVVADSSMMNTDNLSEIKDSGYEFIVGERLKNLPQATQNYLLDLTNYSVMNIPISGENEETISLKYRITTYKNRKILCTYSEKRAKKDRFEREKRIEKAKMLMKNTAQLGKKAAVYYLKSNIVDTQTGEVTDTKQSKSNKIYYQLDEEKIAQAAKYDGLKAIATSDHELSNEDILLKYRDLYQIEQSFRTFKTFLETRPMFHWTDERIKGHFCICYLSFCLLNYLQKLLKQHNQNHSENDIRRTLNKMQITHLQQDGQDYYLRASLDQNTNNLLKIIKMKPLPDLSANPPKINYSTKM